MSTEPTPASDTKPASEPMAGSGSGGGDGAGSGPDPVVQYVVVRKDLAETWPRGALMAQACHASVAATVLFQEDEDVQAYIKDLDNMHKVVVGAKGEAQLTNLAKKLSDASVPHKLWIEQPENYPTCLASKPARRSALQPYFKKFNLLR